MKTVVFNHSTIGDLILTEPAVRGLAITTGEKVNYICNGPANVLFINHPYINFLPPETEIPGDAILINALDAYVSSNNAHNHFSTGFFKQVGIDPSILTEKERQPHFYGGIFDIVPVDRKILNYICISPVSLSCTSRKNPGALPNKMAPLDWWENLIRLINVPVIQLGAVGDPVVSGAEPYFGADLRCVSEILGRSRLLITIETGISLLAGTLDIPILYLYSASQMWFINPLTNAKLESIKSRTMVPPEWNIGIAEQLALRLLI